jgi:hypothetical protein
MPNGCTHCDGHGWITVLPGYVERHAPWPDPPGLGCTDDDQAAYDLAVTACEAARSALARSVYPCKHCRPNLFFRWANGCMAPGHEQGACELCQAVAPRRRGSQPAREPTTVGAPPPEEPPADGDF